MIKEVLSKTRFWSHSKRKQSCHKGLVAAVILFCSSLPVVKCVPHENYVEEVGNNYVARGLFGHSKKEANSDICMTPGCVISAAELLKKIDPEVEPCDDFYKFACGKYLEEAVIPDEKASIMALDVLDDKIEQNLRRIIEEPAKDNEPRPFRMIKDLYNACMDKDGIETIGLTPLKETLKEMGGWPVLEGDDWDSSSFSLLDITKEFRKRGFFTGYIIGFGVGTDLKDSLTRIINLGEASLSLDREYMIYGMQNKTVAALYTYMVDISVAFGAPRERAETELKKVIEFEVKLAEICMTQEEQRDTTKQDNKMKIAELQEKYQSIPWHEYISNLMGDTVEVEADETINIVSLSYITKLEDILKATPERVQANYLFWRVVKSVVKYLTEELRNRFQKFYAEYTGATEKYPRWQECVSFASGLDLAIGSLYVEHFFDKEAKAKALQITESIREKMHETLENVDWMDSNTRKNAIEKVKKITPHIGYPEELLDHSKLEEYYIELIINDENYMEAALKLSKFAEDYTCKQLRKPVEKNDWKSHGGSAVVNAFYDPCENSIEIPAGILQGDYYSKNRPNYLNFGGIGYIAGHEITHGFDDEGSRFDQDGNLKDWWDSKTKTAYEEKTKCVIDQYNAYTAEQVGLQLNGMNTQGENIADNGGLKLAYQAYKSWVEKNGVEPRLPGLHQFSPQQMFWLSAASGWCTRYRDKYLEMSVKTDVHSPSEFRVIGPMSNRPEFAADFNCPVGSKMNPEVKCQVW